MIERPDPAKYATHLNTSYLIHNFIIFPSEKILVSLYGNRAYHPVLYNLDEPSTWRVNSQGQTWMVGMYGRYRNSTLLDWNGELSLKKF